MSRIAALLLLVIVPLASCARHVVVDRNQGIVDGEKSIASMSDAEWTILRQPTVEAEEEEN